MKMSACVDGGLSGGLSVRRPGSEDPIGASGNSSVINIWIVWNKIQRYNQNKSYQIKFKGLGSVISDTHKELEKMTFYLFSMVPLDVCRKTFSVILFRVVPRALSYGYQIIE